MTDIDDRLRIEYGVDECCKHHCTISDAIAEIERLREALVTCSSLAGGQHHPIPSDLCAAIACHVDRVLNQGEVADE